MSDRDQGPGKESVKEDYEGKAHPGEPLEPDELEKSPPEFSPQQAARTEPEPKGHPTSELSTLKSRTPGKPSSGPHPTTELHIKPRRR